jgi:hypothetical protein
MESANIDATGIRLVLSGVHLPWESIRRVRVQTATLVAIDIVGPIVPTGDQPKRWTGRALATLTPGSRAQITTTRPESVVWVASRYADRMAQEPPTMSAPPSTPGLTVRQVKSWTSP